MIIRQSGTLAQRPSGQGWWTTRYYATDNGKVYIGNGGSWREASGPPESNEVNSYISGALGVRPSPDSVLGYIFTDTATGNQYEAFPGNWVAVAAGGGGGFLQPGNNVIQPALDALAGSGGVLRLGAGIFTCSTGINIPAGVSLVGAGMDATIIKANSDLNVQPVGYPFVNIGDKTYTADFTVDVTLASSFPCFGSGDSFAGTRTGTSVNVKTLSGIDGLYFTTTGVTWNYTCYNCVFQTPYDTTYLLCNGNFEFYNCMIYGDSIGKSYPQHCLQTYSGAANIRWFGGSITGLNDANGFTNYGVVNFGSGVIEVYGTRIRISGGDPSDVFDLFNGGSGEIRVLGVVRYDGLPLITQGTIKGQQANTILSPLTVATLPAAPALGMVAYVTNGTAALAWGATVTGGGSTKYLVMWNGTNWTVIGK